MESVEISSIVERDVIAIVKKFTNEDPVKTKTTSIVRDLVTLIGETINKAQRVKTPEKIEISEGKQQKETEKEIAKPKNFSFTPAVKKPDTYLGVVQLKELLTNNKDSLPSFENGILDIQPLTANKYKGAEKYNRIHGMFRIKHTELRAAKNDEIRQLKVGLEICQHLINLGVSDEKLWNFYYNIVLTSMDRSRMDLKWSEIVPARVPQTVNLKHRDDVRNVCKKNFIKKLRPNAEYISDSVIKAIETIPSNNDPELGVISYTAATTYLRLLAAQDDSVVIVGPDSTFTANSFTPCNVAMNFPKLPTNWTKIVWLIDITSDNPNYKRGNWGEIAIHPEADSHTIVVLIHRNYSHFMVLESNNDHFIASREDNKWKRATPPDQKSWTDIGEMVERTLYDNDVKPQDNVNILNPQAPFTQRYTKAFLPAPPKSGKDFGDCILVAIIIAEWFILDDPKRTTTHNFPYRHAAELTEQFRYTKRLHIGKALGDYMQNVSDNVRKQTSSKLETSRVIKRKIDTKLHNNASKIATPLIVIDNCNHCGRPQNGDEDHSRCPRFIS